MDVDSRRSIHNPYDTYIHDDCGELAGILNSYDICDYRSYHKDYIFLCSLFLKSRRRLVAKCLNAE